MKNKKREAIISAIFGEHGVTASPDMDIFEHRILGQVVQN